MRPPRRPVNSPRSLYFIAATFLFVVLGFFLTRPFVESGDAANAARRWLLLFAPLDDPNFMEFVWRGLDLPDEPETGERWFALGLGVVATLALLGVGSLAFAPFKRLLKTTVFETIFFQFGFGFALVNLYFQIAGLARFADASLTLPTFAFAFLYVLSALIATSRRFIAARDRARARDRDRDVLSSSLIPTQKLGDRVLLTLQTLLLTLFTSFYFFASTQPLFEYDVVEYHAQAAREIFETGALSFSPNNVYANMPLGAETLYVGGLNLVRDLCAAPDAPLRLGSLVGKVVLTAVAFATALGLFAFCVRFFRSGRAGLFAALFYLAFPGVFDVFANGLNDGALGFALFAAFYAFALPLAADATRCDRPIFRVATASFIGVYVGLALSIKYTAVVFVFAPAFAALLVLSFPTFATPLRRLFRDAESTLPADDATSETSNNCDAPSNAALAPVSPPKPLAFRLLKDVCLPLVVFVATVALVSGGWFVRNVSATGNPFYPLAFEQFDDASQTWDADVDARWRRAHSASTFGPAAFAESFARSAWRADLASPFSPLLPAIGLLVLIGAATRLNRRRRRDDLSAASSERNRRNRNVLRLAFIAAVALLFWLGWFFATHRLTRFLVPVEPLSALLLGVASSFAATGFRSRDSIDSTASTDSSATASAPTGRAFFLVAFYATFLFGLLYEGLVIDVRAPARIAPLRALERDPARFPQASLFFNDRPELFADAASANATAATTTTSDAPVRPSRKLLLIGEAKAFVYRVPVVYSTCWNRSPLIPLLGDSVERDADGKIAAIRDADAIRRRFDDAKIAFVLVDFAELARFRSPGNYGFRDVDIDENLFRLLTAANVLAPFELPPTSEKNDATSTAPETTRVFRLVPPSNDAASPPN